MFCNHFCCKIIVRHISHYWLLVCTLEFLHLLLIHPSVCVSERVAAMVLGYTQGSWDVSEQQQPVASFLSWAALTDEEKAAGTLLGYTAASWDNLSGSEPQPALMNKSWSELTSCPDGEDTSTKLPLALS